MGEPGDNYVTDKTINVKNILQLTAKSRQYINRSLSWLRPHYSNQGGKPGSAIRKGNYKLINNYEDKSVELHDVVNDFAEKNDIAATNKIIVKQLKKELFECVQQTHAFFPDANFNYDPSSKTEARSQDE